MTIPRSFSRNSKGESHSSRDQAYPGPNVVRIGRKYASTEALLTAQMLQLPYHIVVVPFAPENMMERKEGPLAGGQQSDDFRPPDNTLWLRLQTIAKMLDSDNWQRLKKKCHDSGILDAISKRKYGGTKRNQAYCYDALAVLENLHDEGMINGETYCRVSLEMVEMQDKRESEPHTSDPIL